MSESIIGSGFNILVFDSKQTKKLEQTRKALEKLGYDVVTDTAEDLAYKLSAGTIHNSAVALIGLVFVYLTTLRNVETKKPDEYIHDIIFNKMTEKDIFYTDDHEHEKVGSKEKDYIVLRLTTCATNMFLYQANFDSFCVVKHGKFRIGSVFKSRCVLKNSLTWFDKFIGKITGKIRIV